MFTIIEIISGQILILLEDKGKLSFYVFTKIINEPELLIMLSLQWLVRLGCITENVSTREYIINGQQQPSKEEELMLELTSI